MPKYTLAELGQAFKAKHPGVYDSYSDDDIANAFLKKYPGKYDSLVSVDAAAPDTMQQEAPPEAGPNYTGTGAMIGGLIGGGLAGIATRGTGIPQGANWGARAGALAGPMIARAVGAAAGGTAGAMGGGALTDSLDVDRSLAEGGEQGLLEFGGGVLEKATDPLKKWVLKKLTKAAVRMTDRAAKTAVKYRIPMNAKGWEKLQGSNGVKWKVVEDVNKMARAHPGKIPTVDVANDVWADVATHLSERDVNTAEHNWLAARVIEFEKTKGKDLSMDRALRLKRHADTQVRQLRNSVGGSDRKRSVQELYYQSLGNVLRERMEHQAPELMKVEKTIGDMKALQKFMGTIGKYGSPNSRSNIRIAPAVIAGGFGATGQGSIQDRSARAGQYALATYLLTDPRAMVQAFRLLQSPAVSEVTRQIPRGLEALFGE